MIGTRAITPDYCATGITGESKHDLQAPAARVRVCFDLTAGTHKRGLDVATRVGDGTGTKS